MPFRDLRDDEEEVRTRDQMMAAAMVGETAAMVMVRRRRW
jgi:hypothetical protein